MSGISGLGEPLPPQPLRASNTEKDGQQGGQYFGSGGKNPKDTAPDPTEKTDEYEAGTNLMGPPRDRPVAEIDKPIPLKESSDNVDNSSELRFAVAKFNAESIERGKSFRILLTPRPKGGLLLELEHPTSGKYAILGDRDASHIELDAIKTRLNALIEGSSGNLFNDKA